MWDEESNDHRGTEGTEIKNSNAEGFEMTGLLRSCQFERARNLFPFFSFIVVVRERMSHSVVI